MKRPTSIMALLLVTSFTLAPSLAQARLPGVLVLATAKPAGQSDSAPAVCAKVTERLRRTGWYRVYDQGDLVSLTVADPACDPANATTCEKALEQLAASGMVVIAQDAGPGGLTARWRSTTSDVLQSFPGADPDATSLAIANWIRGQVSVRRTGSANTPELDTQDNRLPQPARALRWTWLVGGTAVTAATCAGLVGLNARSKEHRFQSVARQAQTEARPAQEVVELADTAERQALLANIFWGVAAAAAVGTGVAFGLEYGFRENTPAGQDRWVLGPRVGPDGLGLAIVGRY